MSWFWANNRADDQSRVVRIVRVLHWCIVGFAIFGLVVSYFGIIEAGDIEPISFFAVGFMWFAVALLGRGLRYIIIGE